MATAPSRSRRGAKNAATKPTSERSGPRAVHIREAAAALFAERGYHGTSTRDIAERVGILQGSLYGHFASKEEILFQILTAAAREEINRLRPIAEESAPADVRLKKALVEVLKAGLENRALNRRLATEWRALGSKLQTRLKKSLDEVSSLWEGIISDGVREGVFDCNPKFGRVFSIEAARSVLSWYDPKGPMRFDDILEELLKFIQHGLAGGANQTDK